jgi:hypothetical protein
MDHIRFVPVSLVLLLALLPGHLNSQEVRIRGFINGSFLYQDADFAPGNGHRALWVTEGREDAFHLWDVRSTRLGLDITGPALFGDWRAAGTVEADFHGAFGVGGVFGDEQPQLRLRLAYADLTDGRTTLRIGQQWSLTHGNIPVSTTHTGFIAGWGTGGVLGWRFPGVSFTQELTAARAATTVSLKLAVLRGSWSGPEGPAPETMPPGPADFGVPQLEARLDLGGTTTEGTWGIYVVGHYDRKDFEKAGVAPPPNVERTLSSWAAQAGARFVADNVTVHGNAYAGRAMGHHFAHFARLGDISGWGAWGQVGVNVTRRWSLWTMVGIENPDAQEMTTAGGDQEQGLLVLPMLRFQAGPYELGLEWFHNRVDVVGDETRTGNQIAFSTRFSF